MTTRTLRAIKEARRTAFRTSNLVPHEPAPLSAGGSMLRLVAAALAAVVVTADIVCDYKVPPEGPTSVCIVNSTIQQMLPEGDNSFDSSATPGGLQIIYPGSLACGTPGCTITLKNFGTDGTFAIDGTGAPSTPVWTAISVSSLIVGGDAAPASIDILGSNTHLDTYTPASGSMSAVGCEESCYLRYACTNVPGALWLEAFGHITLTGTIFATHFGAYAGSGPPGPPPPTRNPSSNIILGGVSVTATGCGAGAGPGAGSSSSPLTPSTNAVGGGASHWYNGSAGSLFDIGNTTFFASASNGLPYNQLPIQNQTVAGGSGGGKGLPNVSPLGGDGGGTIVISGDASMLLASDAGPTSLIAKGYPSSNQGDDISGGGGSGGMVVIIMQDWTATTGADALASISIDVSGGDSKAGQTSSGVKFCSGAGAGGNVILGGNSVDGLMQPNAVNIAGGASSAISPLSCGSGSPGYYESIAILTQTATRSSTQSSASSASASASPMSSSSASASGSPSGSASPSASASALASQDVESPSVSPTTTTSPTLSLTGTPTVSPSAASTSTPSPSPSPTFVPPPAPAAAASSSVFGPLSTAAGAGIIAGVVLLAALVLWRYCSSRPAKLGSETMMLLTSGGAPDGSLWSPQTTVYNSAPDAPRQTAVDTAPAFLPSGRSPPPPPPQRPGERVWRSPSMRSPYYGERMEVAGVRAAALCATS